MRESAQALEAFTIYRDMGPDRSHQAVAQACSKSVSLIRRWSAAYGWVERCRQHDAVIARESAERDKKARLSEMDKLRRVRLGIAQSEQAIALKWLQRVVNDDKTIGQMKAADIVALVKGAQDTQRLEYGEATNRTAVDLECMDNDELIAYGRSLGLNAADPRGAGDAAPGALAPLSTGR